MNIVEFAKQLNLSTGTVSRALNDRAEVSEKTRKLVLEKAKELGFVPNVNARRLVTGRTNLIQFECPYNTHIMSDRYLVELARALEEAAGNHGYDLLLHLGTRRRAAGEVQAVDGLVIAGDPDMLASDINKLTSNGRTAAVLIIDAYREPLEGVSTIRLDTLCGVREAFHLLAANGHQRIGYIGSVQSDVIRENLQLLMTETKLPWHPELVVEAGVTPAEGAKAATELLSRPDRPTAIFARTDVLATATIHTARQLGLSVPGELSVIGHDNIETAAIVDPPLTTVAVDIPSVAAAAVEALVSLIGDRETASYKVLGTQLVTRQSVGPAPARPMAVG